VGILATAVHPSPEIESGSPADGGGAAARRLTTLNAGRAFRRLLARGPGPIPNLRACARACAAALCRLTRLHVAARLSLTDCLPLIGRRFELLVNDHGLREFGNAVIGQLR
jgi:hypothetical protein